VAGVRGISDTLSVLPPFMRGGLSLGVPFGGAPMLLEAFLESVFALYTDFNYIL
jgi:hypothetical protein